MRITRTLQLLLNVLFVGLMTVGVGCSDSTPSSGEMAASSIPSSTPDLKSPSTTPRVALPVGKPVAGDALQLPYILWGGDMATFYGNGGKRTVEGSVFHQNGVVVDLVDGNDFDKQIADYTSGKSPFLRGTFRMIGVAAEKLGDGEDRPLVFMQMTWSAGDHMVTRESIKTLTDLKGKKVAIQKARASS